MIDADDQALILGSLIGMSAVTVALLGLVYWFFRART